jgi:hypothetical protein
MVLACVLSINLFFAVSLKAAFSWSFHIICESDVVSCHGRHKIAHKKKQSSARVHRTRVLLAMSGDASGTDKKHVGTSYT